MNRCLDCGRITEGGICSGCQEELFILTHQIEDVDGVSPEFAAKAEKQSELLKRRMRQGVTEHS